jgi:hypothetical protein
MIGNDTLLDEARLDETLLDGIVEEDETIARRIGEAIRPETAREVLSRSEHRCEVCRAYWPAGSVLWTGKQSFKAGRSWRTVYVCPFCPTPREPLSRVSAERLQRWNLAHAKRGRGRPAVTLTGPERVLVVELRASGLGELRLAREFRARTGRQVSARTLARCTRA